MSRSCTPLQPTSSHGYRQRTTPSTSRTHLGSDPSLRAGSSLPARRRWAHVLSRPRRGLSQELVLPCGPGRKGRRGRVLFQHVSLGTTARCSPPRQWRRGTDSRLAALRTCRWLLGRQGSLSGASFRLFVVLLMWLSAQRSSSDEIAEWKN